MKSRENLSPSVKPLTITRLACLLGLIALSGCGLHVYSTAGSTTPSSLSYRCSTQLFLEANSNTADTPTLGSGTGVTYSISPALPSGMALDPSTGVISGTPTVASGQTAYTVTASNAAGSTTATVNIETANGWLVNDLAHDEGNAGGAGSCSSTTYGTCTLRAAIDEIDTGSSTKTAILLPSGATTLSSGLGQLTISQPVAIYGDCAQGTTVDGGGATQIFGVTAGPTSFTSMTVQNGFGNNIGGAGFLITNPGVPTFSVTFDDLTVQNNSITGPGPGGQNGAGVMVGGSSGTEEVSLVVKNCIFYNNQDNSTNTPFGGAIHFDVNSTGVIDRSSFIQNASSGGGAISYLGTALTITNSLFDGNASTGYGGAVDIVTAGSGTLAFTNDTFYDNSGNGAVISTNNATTKFLNCTFAFNTAPGGSGAVYTDESGGTVSFQNSLFLGNLANGISGHDCGGAGSSNGNNLTDSTAGDCNLSQASDLTGTSALLGPLRDNGGLTKTLALLSGSPGIDEANIGACPSTDQRGYPRLTDGQCDIGAFELQP